MVLEPLWGEVPCTTGRCMGLLMICSADDGRGEPDTQTLELALIKSSVNAQAKILSNWQQAPDW